MLPTEINCISIFRTTPTSKLWLRCLVIDSPIDIIASARLSFHLPARPCFSCPSHDQHSLTSTPRFLDLGSVNMASELDQKSLEQAFQGRADIQAAIRAAAGMPLSLVFLHPSSSHLVALDVQIKMFPRMRLIWVL